MRAQLALCLGVVFCLGSAGGGCGGGDRDARYFGTTDRHGRDASSLYLNGNDEPETLDPGLCSDRSSTTLIAELFEGLVVLHPDDLHPTAAVATSWDQSDDNRLFRFHLREDARWSDGKPVRAQDFVYAWRRVLSPELGARMATILYPLRNAKEYHEGRLLRSREAATMRAKPSDKSPELGALPAGASVRVRMASQVEVRGSVVPLGEPLVGGALRFLAKAKGGGADDVLDPSPAAPAVHGTADGGWAGRKADVVAHGPPAVCNGKPDRWYLLSADGEQGYLPGCALTARMMGSSWLLVSPHDERPTFERSEPRPAAGTDGPPPADARSPGGASPAVAAAPSPLGWIRAELLERDVDALGVRAADDSTLDVELAEPTPYFLELLSYPTTFPVRSDLVERAAEEGRPDDWTRPGRIVGNGPYVLDTWTFRYEITMKRNRYHYDHDRLRVHRIVWMLVPQHNPTMNLYRTGELDYLGPHVSLPSAYIDRLSRYQDFVRSRYLATYWLELNVTRPPLDDVRVRRALNLAIDKQLLVEAIHHPELDPATHFVPDFTGSGYAAAAKRDREAGHDPFHGPGLDFDPEAARALLGEAGYPVEKRADGWHTAGFPAFELLYNNGEGHQKIAVVVQQMWRSHLGVSVALRSEEWKVMLQNIRDGNFQVARFGWTADYNHPHTWLDTFLSYSAQNWTRWKNQAFDALVEQAAATADTTASIALYRQAERLAVDEMPRIPIYFYSKSTMVKPYVRGFYPNPKNEHPLRYVWIDPDWRNQPESSPAFPPHEFPPAGRLDSPPRRDEASP